MGARVRGGAPDVDTVSIDESRSGFNTAATGSRMHWIGVDVGGTFTDVVVYDEATGALERRERVRAL